MEFKENLRKIKQFFNVDTNKELAEKLELSVSALEGWQKRKVIPKKYLKLLDNNIFNNGNNNIGINHGTIHINSSNEMQTELCKIIKELSPKRTEYYFYKIKAELLENEK